MYTFYKVSTWLLMGTLLWPQTAATFEQVYPAQLLKVIDADTVKVRLELLPHLYHDTHLRLAGIDAPESRRGIKAGQRITECEVKAGKQATQFVTLLLASVTDIWVKQIKVHNKYANRMVGELWYQSDATHFNLAQQLLEQGLAQPYTGGTRQQWPCNGKPHHN